MLGEYKVSRCTRQCHTLGRALREGEWYYSVVLPSGDDFVRLDFSAEAWTEPPEGAIGWWKNRMPTADEKKMVLAPPEVLVDLLREMGQQPGQSKSRYLLALMLMRRKIVRPADNPESNRQPGGDDRDDATGDPDRPAGSVDGKSMLTVEVISTGESITLPVETIRRAESETLREQLNELLYCEVEPD